jgi:glucose-1-phosphate thymidylyltransferase
LRKIGEDDSSAQVPLESRALVEACHPELEFADVIGLVPAAGLATRIGPLPFSKELFPIMSQKDGQAARPRAVCEFLLSNMRTSGISKVHIIVRKGKWDIPSYLVMGHSYGVPYTLNQAYSHVSDHRVALGFPDTVFFETDAYRKCLVRQGESGADVVLGLFPAARPEHTDMVDIDDMGHVSRIVVKPAETDLELAWAIAVWTPCFTEFMHKYLATHLNEAGTRPELFVGDVVQAAIERGLRVEGVPVSDRSFLDIGTPDGLAQVTGFVEPEGTGA